MTLSPQHRERLKTMTVIYCYLMFNPANQHDTETALHELGIENVTFIYARSMADRLLEQTEIFETTEQQQLVKNFLENVGYELIVSQKNRMAVFQKTGVRNGHKTQRWDITTLSRWYS